MATTATSTVAATQAAFVSAAQDAVPGGVTVWRTWPGQRATQRMAFFSDVEWVDTEDNKLKDGRRWRDESYNARFEVWHLVEGTPDGGAEAIAGCFEIYDACEDVIARDGSPVMAVPGVRWIVCQPLRMEPIEFGAGWGAALTAQLSVRARLT